MKKVIAYVGTNDLDAILETDILKIDVINIAFGHINHNVITWKAPVNVKESFERIRRITGYLVGTLDRFNDAKRAEEHDRIKHG